MQTRGLWAGAAWLLASSLAAGAALAETRDLGPGLLAAADPGAPAAPAPPEPPPQAQPPAQPPQGQPPAQPPRAQPPAQPPQGQPPAQPQPKPKAGITDEDVLRAIQKGKEYLINQQNPDGSFPKGAAGPAAGGPGNMRGCYSALVFMTLAYIGEHLNRDVMEKAFLCVTALNPDRDFADRQGYALPIRAMGLCYVCKKNLSQKKREAIREFVKADLSRLITSQQRDGGWRYRLVPTEDFDFSVTQWGILAIREATRIDLELPPDPLKKALALYERGQNRDGGWAYQIGPQGSASTPAMTAAGLASLYILSDALEPAGPCPCGRSRSAAGAAIDRRIDAALAWIADQYKRQGQAAVGGAWGFYGLYCAERVGIAAGYKYIGGHHWYKEGAEYLVKAQAPDGSWGSIENTCFALLFLYKGRAPVLFNKLRFQTASKTQSDQEAWNAHRRDMATLTRYIERLEEGQFHWQIVDLAAPLDELHDAPILYITADAVPAFSDADKQKLRAFTDTGGTILVEASCGNAAVRRSVEHLAKEVWPEWPLVKLPKDHVSFQYRHPLDKQPEVLGIDDGLRTIVYYSPDDVSCQWQTNAIAGKEYLFKWGINLYTCATDGAELRAKLQVHEAPTSDRYKDPIKAGPRTTIKIARVKHPGNWAAGANYAPFKELAKRLSQKAGVTLEVRETNAKPVNEGGVAPADLKGCPVAYLTGSGEFTLTDADKAGLKAYVEEGGFLWVEAARGSQAFDSAWVALAKDLGWELRLLEKTHPLITGRMDPALGYNLTQGLGFRRVLKFRKTLDYAEFHGIHAGGKMVGLYSPRDILFSLTPYEACGCRGYKTEDAAAVATNIVLYLTTQK